MGFKSSSINSTSPYADRILSLSEIDSLFQNSEITEEEARKMVLQSVSNGTDTAVISAVFGGK